VDVANELEAYCFRRGIQLDEWSDDLDNGININWTGSDIEFEKFIEECYGYDALVEMERR
jgi:hypothetical protein